MHLPPIRELLPHRGAMCLLETVLEWSDTGVRCVASSHRAPSHPLRDEAGLRAVHLCEYGAQAMAVHGGLLAWRDGGRAAPGMLVALRGVRLHVARIDALPGELVIEATRLLAGDASWQYGFTARHRETLLAEGRAAVMLSAPGEVP